MTLLTTEPRFRFTGWDGQEFSFGDPSCPLRLNNIEGLGGAPAEFVDIVGAGQAGVTFVDLTDQPNVITLNLRFGPLMNGETIKGTAAVEAYSGWRKSLGRGRKVGKFECLDTGRFQMVRPSISQMSPYNLREVHNVGFIAEERVPLRSDESYWRTDPFDQTFSYGETITVDNLGDDESWPWYQITGPITAPRIGLDGEAITIKRANGATLTIPAGKTLTVQTDPDWWEVVDSDGVDHSWLGERWHKRAPEDTEGIPVTFTGTSTTSATKIRVVVPQLFWTAI
ncbi:minor tail protein [Gordonia phage Bjanes7]|uniref:Minor tail protein n=5 Tax=Attisvirus TaxID=2169652 RepID=A0A142K8Q8_9CAUD|nr:minor tail protein [Gordonia phage SoilAssassin]YP_009595774.1 minor tail protein [Gordonia phage Attis]YP_010653589.1 minor tail protein [Gordonia phage Yeet412]YP_010653805.1 minor tail protein [Gordonia phage Bjanes7]QDF18336.1 minor tail protein [Gordonia phage LordFarquaad]AMS02417.1 minor tail protein [Gordonia phage SoilAssassin]AMS02491.1 minor tail protein [Gordonia phage Attis]ATW60714.1 minor tail protein [Gordonia phage Bjanes7]QWY84525.1 minor tail protein [Gordonia phage Ye